MGLLLHGSDALKKIEKIITLFSIPAAIMFLIEWNFFWDVAKFKLTTVPKLRWIAR